MPFACSTCLATPLSIDTELPSTPVPTNAMFASSSNPCTVPSSPSGPCNRGNTTVCELSRASPTTTEMEVGAPSVERVGPTCSGPRCRSAIACVAKFHLPSRVMPIALMRYFSGSRARSTCAAVTQLTSCSADSPPNNTITCVGVCVVTMKHGTR